ncbi:hypothetical protein CONPUDRAFT_166648 [Coniophora puteana RWD-64-598 SS2]|uniref:C3H1-type domain-containing protein n=1 Tax=Coniophora puteana (strain RWD-64-598) TaxID=741705 RepID=A0A5M3MLX0_CONPW|nr:uncharacterized protein CONPUDRAFT_166648 [Coniophora puteana RWD-64-598 SS2]EIW80036.1 hypothetical protein CONPUDRAFT_166648 [Coniophora puteana RWD-64-598 SS2]
MTDTSTYSDSDDAFLELLADDLITDAGINRALAIQLTLYSHAWPITGSLSSQQVSGLCDSAVTGDIEWFEFQRAIYMLSDNPTPSPSPDINSEVFVTFLWHQTPINSLYSHIAPLSIDFHHPDSASASAVALPLPFFTPKRSTRLLLAFVEHPISPSSATALPLLPSPALAAPKTAKLRPGVAAEADAEDMRCAERWWFLRLRLRLHRRAGNVEREEELGVASGCDCVTPYPSPGVYGTKCHFANGEGELRSVARHPKYKTEICRTFWVSGACPYGKRCCFIHTELPANGAAPGAEGVPPPSATIDSRQRANSSASDPSDAPTSLLSRISHSRHDLATPIDTNSAAHNMYNTRPPTGSLRVDTASLTNIAKQNKSAYPTLASQQNALMMNPRESAIHSPVPLTAGPDLGRSTAARLNIVGQNQRVRRTNTSNPRHSFNGADVDFEYASPTTPSAANVSSSFGMGSQNDRLSTSGTAPRSHVRSGSAGNWGSLTRSNLSVAFPQSELAVGSNRVSNNAQWI